MDPTCVFNFFTFFERILYKSNCIIFIFSWCATHTKIRSKLVVVVTAGSQKIALWGPQRTPLGIIRVNVILLLTTSFTELYLSVSNKHFLWTSYCPGFKDALIQGNANVASVKNFLTVCSHFLHIYCQTKWDGANKPSIKKQVTLLRIWIMRVIKARMRRAKYVARKREMRDAYYVLVENLTEEATLKT